MSAQSSSHYQKGTDEKWVCFNDKTCPKAQFEVILLWEICYCYLAVFGMSVYQAILNYLFLCKRDILRMFPCQSNRSVHFTFTNMMKIIFHRKFVHSKFYWQIYTLKSVKALFEKKKKRKKKEEIVPCGLLYSSDDTKAEFNNCFIIHSKLECIENL